MNTRRSGVLLHPTSLPSPYGIGDLGDAAIDFLDFLAEAEQGLWQILPLGNPGYGDSPYQCYSAFAGNPLLIDPEWLVEQGLLSHGELPIPSWGRSRDVEYTRCRNWKAKLLRTASARLAAEASGPLWSDFEEFYTREGWWLHDYALFMTLKDLHEGRSWNEWPPELRAHEQEALEETNERHQPQILFHKFCQFAFYTQWELIRKAARDRDIRILGDMPIFVSFDSADVWGWSDFFRVNGSWQPEVVAGVPPDYFSETGQLWGNPLYDWEAMASDSFWWWRSRFQQLMRQADVIRVDHFRGFEACWEIPGDAPTAETGRWIKVPGRELFQELQQSLPDLRLIAEDLGLITKEVKALREEFRLPGMKVLQFAFFGDSGNPFLPHNYEQHCVAYTGTHDNNTMLGFMDELDDPKAKRRMFEYLGIHQAKELPWAAVKAVWASTAEWALAPMQDLLELGTTARMNLPGTVGNNWRWRLGARFPRKRLAERLKNLGRCYGRNQLQD